MSDWWRTGGVHIYPSDNSSIWILLYLEFVVTDLPGGSPESPGWSVMRRRPSHQSARPTQIHLKPQEVMKIHSNTNAHWQILWYIQCCVAVPGEGALPLRNWLHPGRTTVHFCRWWRRAEPTSSGAPLQNKKENNSSVKNVQQTWTVPCVYCWSGENRCCWIQTFSDRYHSGTIIFHYKFLNILCLNVQMMEINSDLFLSLHKPEI